jgi:hypothetical protein
MLFFYPTLPLAITCSFAGFSKASVLYRLLVKYVTRTIKVPKSHQGLCENTQMCQSSADR